MSWYNRDHRMDSCGGAVNESVGVCRSTVAERTPGERSDKRVRKGTRARKRKVRE